jgi:hypothetical protein
VHLPQGAGAAGPSLHAQRRNVPRVLVRGGRVRLLQLRRTRDEARRCGCDATEQRDSCT